jgi:hypothetical protein
MLIPPVALKLASTGWRLVRYYRGSGPYVRQGPPHPYMRAVVAPLVVVTTLVLLGTGVAMLVASPHAHRVLQLHKAAFIAWIAATGIHVLFHLPRLVRLMLAELRPATRAPAAGLRVGLVGVAFATGAVFAASVFHLATPWLDWVRVH